MVKYYYLLNLLFLFRIQDIEIDTYLLTFLQKDTENVCTFEYQIHHERMIITVLDSRLFVG